MYEITIRIHAPDDASELLAQIVRSSTYDRVLGICIARLEPEALSSHQEHGSVQARNRLGPGGGN